MSSEYYKVLDEVYVSMRDVVSKSSKSKVLQNFFIKKYNSFFYGNLINNFFLNLTQTKIKENNLPKGQIGKIKNRYKNIQKDARLALTLSLKEKELDLKYYSSFKIKVKKDFPEFQIIFVEIEKEIDFESAKEYLQDKEMEFRSLGIIDANFNTIVATAALEGYITKENTLPLAKGYNKLIKIVIKDKIPIISDQIFESLNKASNKMLYDQRRNQANFETRLHDRWKIALDLFECLIRISLETGDEYTNKLRKTTNNTNNFKREALIKIHVRALQIANEILVLLKSGYADGANARWRSIHELAVISIFLFNENNDTSERYLEYEVVKSFMQAEDYKKKYKKLGYAPIKRSVFNKLKNESDTICKKHNYTGRQDYEWSLLKKKSFKALEEHVKLDKFRPFYNSANNSVHGGAKGFYRLGLMKSSQDAILLAGASNYGLADPLQNTAISLLYINICFLNLEPDLESIMIMNVMQKYIAEIGIKAVSVQKEIVRDDLMFNFTPHLQRMLNS